MARRRADREWTRGGEGKKSFSEHTTTIACCCKRVFAQGEVDRNRKGEEEGPMKSGRRGGGWRCSGRAGADGACSGGSSCLTHLLSDLSTCINS